MITASDNCGIDSICQMPPVGDTLMGTGIDTFPIQFVAKDSFGNPSDTCAFDLILLDVTSPSITCPFTAPTDTLEDMCQLIVPDYTSLATATDNCDPMPDHQPNARIRPTRSLAIICSHLQQQIAPDCLQAVHWTSW